MLTFKNGVKLSKIEEVFSTDDSAMVCLEISVEDRKDHMVVSAPMLGDFVLFNGLKTREQIFEILKMQIGVNSCTRLLDKLQNLDLFIDAKSSAYCSRDDNESFANALLDYEVYVDGTTAVALSLAVIFSYFGMKVFFSCDDRVIEQSDVAENIFLMPSNIGSNLSSWFSDNKLQVTFSRQEYPTNNIIFLHCMSENFGDVEGDLTFNFSDYKNMDNYGFDFFRGNINVSNSLQVLVDNYLWSIRIFEDVLFSLGNGVYP